MAGFPPGNPISIFGKRFPPANTGDTNQSVPPRRPRLRGPVREQPPFDGFFAGGWLCFTGQDRGNGDLSAALRGVGRITVSR